jgi:hypothetical protein
LQAREIEIYDCCAYHETICPSLRATRRNADMRWTGMSGLTRRNRSMTVNRFSAAAASSLVKVAANDRGPGGPQVCGSERVFYPSPVALHCLKTACRRCGLVALRVLVPVPCCKKGAPCEKRYS